MTHEACKAVHSRNVSLVAGPESFHSANLAGFIYKTGASAACLKFKLNSLLTIEAMRRSAALNFNLDAGCDGLPVELHQVTLPPGRGSSFLDTNG